MNISINITLSVDEVKDILEMVEAANDAAENEEDIEFAPVE